MPRELSLRDRDDAELIARVPPPAVAAALTELTLDHVYEFDGARCDRLTSNVMTHIPL